MDRLLSDAELADLTGYEIQSKQLEKLVEIGLRPMIRPDGRPRITMGALTQAMLGNLPPPSQAAAPMRPNFAALKRAG